MRILITGGAGFVGSNLAIAFRERFSGVEIVCMDNLYRRGSKLNLPRLESAGVRFHAGDVREEKSFPTGPFDFLVECSAEPSVLAGMDGSPDYLFKTNLVGAYNCLEKARVWRSGFVFLSTSRVYPIQRLESHVWREEETRFSWLDEGVSGISSRGVSEATSMDGARSLYGYTKYSAELLIEEYRAAYGLRAVIDRCGVIAGPWQFGKVDQGVAALWVLAHHFERPLAYIGYGGHGKQVRDFLHVDDLCRLMAEQIEKFDSWEGWSGNVSGGAGNSASLCELTSLCREITGKRIFISSDSTNRPADLRIFIGDCTRLLARTTWRPQKNVKQIVEDLAAWVRRHETSLREL